MKIEKINTKECSNNFEVLGSCGVSKLGAIVTLGKFGIGMTSIYNINLKIEGLVASLWNMFPLAISAGEGDVDAIKTFKLIKDQALDEIENIMLLADQINQETVKYNSDKEKKN